MFRCKLEENLELVPDNARTEMPECSNIGAVCPGVSSLGIENNRLAEALESVMCNVIKIRLKRSDATRSKIKSQPKNILSLTPKKGFRNQIRYVHQGI